MNTTQDNVTLKDVLVKFREWILFIRRKWVIILMLTLIGGGAGYLYAYIQNKNPDYVGSLNFVLDEEKGNALNAIGLAGLGLGGTDNGIFSSNNILELMKTQSLVENALLSRIQINGKESTLADYYVTINKWRDKSNEHINFASVSDREAMTPEYNAFLKGIYGHIMKYALSIGQRDKKTSFYQITVLCPDEFFAKALAEALVVETSKEYIETKIKKASTTVNILQKQVDSVRAELNSGITGVAKATDNTFNLNPSFNIARVGTTKNQVSVQVNTLMLGELVKNLEVSKVALLKETPLIQVIDKPRFPLPRMDKSVKLLFAVGALLGFIFGIAVVVIYRIFSTLDLK